MDDDDQDRPPQSGEVTEVPDPDDAAVQDEVAERLLAAAARLKAGLEL